MLPRLVVTGASGFVGRHLLDALKEDFRIFGIARRAQHRAGVTDHPNITWLEADVAERPQLESVFD
ncbi:MAG TPA: NAD-dependent epimerase/dehydratase family protein, partial [Vicinamibacterales bacterium]|nr:NAD-dependent epimerase/dehydratase family protein [Vicinamibacterales bacterium]